MVVRVARKHRRRADVAQRGSVLVVAMIALVALLGIGVVTMLTVRSDTTASGADRFRQVAMYAAESGAAAGIDWLRQHCDGAAGYSAYVNPNNATPQSPTDIVGNGHKPGESENPFSTNNPAWYEVTILNNEEDTGYPSGDDTDGVVVLRSVGYGPNRTRLALEVEVQVPNCAGSGGGGSVGCGTDYAQGYVNAQNTSMSGCGGAPVTVAGGLRTVEIGN